MSEFSRNLAVIIGIDTYNSGIPPLQNAVNDAKQLGEILHQKHGYQVRVCVDQAATLSNLETLFEKKLPQIVTADDRLLFYFAGHGIALNSEDGPVGYLIPQNARLGNIQTYLPMTQIQAALEQLPCRHFLGILDCCFAGAFRWGSTRDLLAAPEVIHQERYDRFIQDPAWQIITSAASDQKALDAFALHSDRGSVGEHSPFAAALIEAWSGAADRYPPPASGKPAGDGIVTATELYLYLRDRVEVATESQRQRQTPGIWPLKNHDKGEYIFLTPDHPLNLPPAPPLDESKNPYRGLESFGTEHKDLFFGRSTVIEQLAAFVANRPLTIVLGASGSGKSSLVKAGLIPKLQEFQQQETPETDWFSVVIRPGKSPFAALNVALNQEITAHDGYVDLIAHWKRAHPITKILLVVDQCEELITLCADQQESHTFLNELEKVMTAHPETIQVVLTLRSDFEPQLRDLALKERWQAARYILPTMSRSELREAIEKPAEARVMYFEPHELVEQLIDEVEDMPGALPLLSFALSELYLKYLQRQREASFRGETLDRAITQADYDELGGVTRSLTQRADQEYNALGAAYEQTIQTVMLRMVAVGGGELARRRVSWAELTYPPARAEQVKAVIAQFSAARLLVEGRDAEGDSYVEPAHDALIQGWAKLRDWTKAEKNLDLQRRLTPAALEWKTKQQNRFLWNADPYLEVLHKEVFNSPEHNWLNQVETEFVQRSVQQKQRNVRTRWGIAIAVMLGLSGLAIAAWIGQRNAQIGQTSAFRASAEANFRANEQLNALVDSLRAARGIQQIPDVPNDLSAQVKQTLQNMVYGAKESDRWDAFPGVVSMFLTGDRQLYIITNNDGVVRLRNLSSNQNTELLGQNGLYRGGVSVSSDGSKIATATIDGTVYLWDSQGNQLNNFPAYPCSINDPSQSCIDRISFSSDGSRIAIAAASDGQSQSIRIWHLTDNSYEEFTIGTPGTLAGLGFNPSNELLVAIETESCLKVSKWSDGQIQDVACSSSAINRSNMEARFSPDGERAMIFYGEESENAVLWNFMEGDPLPSIDDLEKNPKRISRGGSFSPDRMRLAETGVDGTVNLLPLSGNEDPTTFKLPQGRVEMSTFSPDGKQLVTLGDDNIIRLWNLDLLDRTPLAQDGIVSVSFSPDGQTIATVNETGTVRLLDLQGDLREEFTGLPKITSVSFSPDGQTIATTGDSGMVRLLDLQGRVTKEFQAHPNIVESVSWSQDGQKIGTIGDGDTEPIDGSKNRSSARLWDTQGEQLKKDEDSLRSEFQSIGFPDGEPIVITKGVTDQDVDNIYNSDFSERSSINLIPGRQAGNSFDFVRLSQDGSLLLTISGNIVRFWNLKGEKLMEFLGNGEIKSLSLSPDNTMLAVVGTNGAAEVWQLGSFEQLLQKGCARVRNYLEYNPEVSESDRTLCNSLNSL